MQLQLITDDLTFQQWLLDSKFEDWSMFCLVKMWQKHVLFHTKLIYTCKVAFQLRLILSQTWTKRLPKMLTAVACFNTKYANVHQKHNQITSDSVKVCVRSLLGVKNTFYLPYLYSNTLL